ncbi:hypothetical protein JW887_00640 [Candidatus Dojkabacteria bacterium]|nr:hypothetical protein [Candidatus Dojkabacteria bacterium]
MLNLILIPMCSHNQEWWNFGASLLTALATLAVVIVALFKDEIRNYLFPVLLKINLKNDTGELTKVDFNQPDASIGGVTHQSIDARYYHLIVRNESNQRTANQTQVFLKKVDELGPGGKFVSMWEGEVPMEWEHQSIYPLARNIGQPISCDLCSVLKPGVLRLHPIIMPNNLKATYNTETVIRLIFQAKCDEGVSKMFKIQIAWDGKWNDGDIEMKKHLIIEELT